MQMAYSLSLQSNGKYILSMEGISSDPPTVTETEFMSDPSRSSDITKKTSVENFTILPYPTNWKDMK